ncbi:MAG: GNAT family N-acetyltransferase [Candidatus Bipolaricaulis sp.]|nr:GNAT family N-acetyltransferase [Candidatus Bipolaricaulis sp.]MDD5645970.1 GNAT family N-acetyltransferase [Candidatus Bipolaricaulis sp.]
MRIREFRIEDYDAVTALWAEARLPFRPNGRDRREAMARELGGERSLFLVAEKDGRVVGVVLGTHDGRKGWINRLAVAPAWRRRGLATALVGEVERRLQRLGIGIVACLIEEENGVSQAAFSELGYKRHSEIVYYAKRFLPEP